MSTLASAIQRGTRGAQPAATAVSVGCLYCVTDESNLVERSNGTTWQSYSASGAGTGTVTNTGTLTANKALIGNGGVDATVSAASGVAHLASGTLTGSNVLLASEVTGVLPGTQGGGLVLLEQHTASSSATLDFTTWYSSTYDDYEIHALAVLPATADAKLLMRMSTNAGVSYDSGTNYGWELFAMAFNATGSDGANGGATSIQLSFGSTTGTAPIVGVYRLFSPGSASLYKMVISSTRSISSTQRLSGVGGGAYEVATAVNAFQFLMSSGNIASGTIRVYGVAK